LIAARLLGIYRLMSKTETLEELAKLTPEKREEIRLKLAELDGNEWLDSDDPLSDKEKAVLEARLDNLEKHPEKSIPWADAEERLKARYGE
jgi:phage-related protein